MTLVNNLHYSIHAMNQAIQEYAKINHLPAGAAMPPTVNLPGSGSSGGSGSGSGGSNSFDLNNMIGRTAHICYLENPVIAFQIIYALLPYFLYDDYPH